jgi:parallel beta-helix repeat protein
MIQELKRGGRFLLTLFCLTLLLMISSNGLSAQQSSSCTTWVHPGESIQKAIDQAPEGTVICLDAGVWKENLKIEKSLTLRGAGSGQTIIEGSKAGYPVLWVTNHISSEEMSEGGLTLSGLTIMIDGKVLESKVVQTSRSVLVDIDGVKITGAYGQSAEELNRVRPCGIMAQDAARVEISNSVISANEGSGLWFIEFAQGKIDNCTVSQNGCKDAGVWLQDSARVSVTNSKVSENGGGIYLNDSAQATITGSEVLGSFHYGIFAQSSSQVEIASCSIVENGDNAILLSDSAEGTITQSVISHHQGGIHFKGLSQANISDCTIYCKGKSFGAGILLEESAHADIVTCAISNNLLGAQLLGTTQACFVSCTIFQNGGGIFLMESSQASISNCSIFENEVGIECVAAAQATVVGNSITDNERYGVAIAQQPCGDTDQVFSGHILGGSNSIPGPSEHNGNMEAGVCPEWLDYLTEPSILSASAYQLQEDPSLCLEICYDHPGKLNREEDYSVVEAIYRFLLGQGLYGRVVTRHRQDVDADKPEILIARREHPIAAECVPNEVIELVQKFLIAYVERDQSAIELFSSRVRESFSDEDLKSFMSGTSNPHHCGYFIHSITPYQDGWTVVVSLFDHYTGYNLELDPEKNQCSFHVAREEQYVIDSLPYLEAKTTQLVQDGTLYSLQFVERIRGAPQPYTFTIRADGELLYNSVGYWLAIDRVEDVTGDGLKEVVLKRSMGGNCVGCSEFYVLRLAESRVTPLWPDKNVICPHDDCGCEGMLKDLDGDRIPELLTTDTRFGHWGPLSNYCTAGQPYVPIVYSWDGNHYRYASMDFPEAYQDILARIQSTAPEDVRNIDPHGEYGSRVYSHFSQLVRLMLCYDHMGLKDEGWKELHRLVQDWDFERIWDVYANEHEESPLHVYLDNLQEEFFGVPSPSS